MDSVKKALGADRCAILLSDGDGDEMYIAASTGLSERFQRIVQRIMPWGRDAAEPAPVYVEDVVHCRELPPALQERTLSEGVQALAILPLISQGELIGRLVAYHEEPLTFSQAYRQLAQIIAGQLSLAAAQERAPTRPDAGLELLALMSHELRQPVTTIYGGSLLLEKRLTRLSETDKSEVITDIRTQSERILKALQDLIALSRTYSGQAVEREPLVLENVLRESVSSFVRAHRGREIELDFAEAKHLVLADQGYLDHVLQNLLTNSDKYSAEGLPIEVRVRSGENSAQVSVLDRGVGIEPGEAETIFDTFYRSRKTSQTAAGTGLGLAVCKRLIESLGGRISAHPREGGGLEVSFTLPLHRDSSPPDKA